MTTFYAIKSENRFGTNYVRAENGRYAALGKVPTLFATSAEAKAVVRDYKHISANSNKSASPMAIVPVEL